jgi:hypothetical protein
MASDAIAVRLPKLGKHRSRSNNKHPRPCSSFVKDTKWCQRGGLATRDFLGETLLLPRYRLKGVNGGVEVFSKENQLLKKWHGVYY